MKFLILMALSVGSASFAQTKTAPYDLKSKEIVGKYVLQTSDEKLEVQSAQIYFDRRNNISLYVDGIDKDLDINNPDASGLINKEEYEPIDCDHDETTCGYVESTEVYLRQTKNARGELVPQLEINVLESVYNAKKSKRGNPVYEDIENTYTLIWSENLPHGGLPVFTEKKVAALESYLKSCKPMAKKFYSYPSDQVFCPQVITYGSRFTMDEAVEATIGGSLKNKRTKKTTYTELQGTFFKLVEDNLADALAHRGNAKIEPQLQAQVAKLKSYFKKKSADGAKFYYFTAEYGDQVYVIDEKSKTIFEFSYYKIKI